MEEISREKLNIQFRIRAIDSFSKTMNKLERKLDKAKASIATLPDGKVNVTANTKKFDRQMKKLEVDLRLLDNVDLNIDANANSAIREIERTNKSIDRLEEEMRMEMRLGTGRSKEEIRSVERQLVKLDAYRRRLNATKTEIDVKVVTDTSKFHKDLAKMRVDMELLDDIKIDADADVKKATTNINRLRNQLDRMEKEISIELRTETNKSRADLKRLRNAMEQVKQKSKELDRMSARIDIDIDVYGDVKAKRDLDKVERAADKLDRKNVGILVWTNAGDALKSFRKDMGYIATLSRDIGEVIGRALTSALVMAGTTGVASMGALAGAIGAIGPMVGALAGGAFGLATALGVAGIAAGGFGAAAFPSIKKVFDANTKLKELQEDLGEAKDEEERAAILKEMASITDSLTSRQQKAMGAIKSLSKSYSDLGASMEPQAMYVFTHSVAMLEGLMKSLTPMIEDAAKAAVNLTDSLRLNLDAADFKAFIGFLNTSASPIMQDIFKGLGNFTMGLVNMMTAFGPASAVIAKGFNNMGRDFRKWADGLKESERFNSFIEYTLREGPKVLAIFGGLTQGIVDMFAAFGPLSSDMNDGLLDMIDGFKEWARTLGDNPAFIEFTDWVRTHGPELLEFFGELRDFLINLGIGFATVSETITPFLTNMLDMFNTFMENNRWIGETVAWLITLAGAIMSSGIMVRTLKFLFDVLRGTFVPLVKGIKTVYTWLNTKLLPIFTRLYLFTSQSVIPILSKLWNVFLKAGPILSRVGGFFVRFVSGPIGWIASGLVFLAGVFDVSFTDIWNVTKYIFGLVSGWVTSSIGHVVATGKIIGDWVDDVKGFFGDMWTGIKESMGRIWDKVTGVWDDIVAFLDGVSLYDIGVGIIDGLASGISSAVGTVTSAIGGVVDDAIGWAKEKLGINSPSRVFMDIGEGTGKGMVIGINDMKRKVSMASQGLANASIPNANGHSFQGINMNSTPNNRFYKQDSSGDSSRSYNDRERITVEVPVNLDRREIARITVDDITEIQERRKKDTEAFSMRGGL